MRLLGPRLASENPVVVERLNRAVLTLEIDPGAEEACQFLVTPRHVGLIRAAEIYHSRA